MQRFSSGLWSRASLTLGAGGSVFSALSYHPERLFHSFAVCVAA